jgi:hypothetical protein
VAVGERLFGYPPMSTELVITPTHLTTSGFADDAGHRAALPFAAGVQRYVRCATDPGYDHDLEAEQMRYRPLLFTWFLIDDHLADNDMFGASTVVLGSASSKTAFGTAHLLPRRSGLRVVGSTSNGNAEFFRSLGCDDDVVTYDDVAALPDGPAVFVDMRSNSGVVRPCTTATATIASTRPWLASPTGRSGPARPNPCPVRDRRCFSRPPRARFGAPT